MQIKKVKIDDSINIDSKIAVDALQALYSARERAKNTLNNVLEEKPVITDDDIQLNEIASIIISLGAKPN